MILGHYHLLTQLGAEVAALLAAHGIEPEIMDFDQAGIRFLIRIQPGKGTPSI